MKIAATSVKDYLSKLPADRRAAIEAVRATILENLDKDYEEGLQYGMIGYYVPHRIFPDGYHCDPKQPLPFAGLGSQKQYMSLYLMCTWGNLAFMKWFHGAWAKTGKKLDMGKSCIRFTRIEDLALDVIGEAIRRHPARDFIGHYVKLRDGARKPKSKTSKKTQAKVASKR